MKKVLYNWQQSFLKEIKDHPVIYILLTIILLVSLFIRIYRVGELLQFYFDQGRDALVIWDLWHKGKPFLIGPVTGLAGLFLGPFYYYLIAPFYLIGGGNPAYPAAFLSFLSVCSLVVIYYLGWKMQSRLTGLIAATIGGFSYYMMLAGRWLSNPTPILFTSTLLLLSLWKILECKSKSECRNLWPIVALLVGLSMQFESASAIFYIPMILVFTLWQWKKFPPLMQFLLSLLLFTLTFAPQLLFNFRHENLLFNNFSKLFLEEKGFQLDFWEVLHTRMSFFWGVFSSKINPTYMWANILFTLIALASALFHNKKLGDKKIFGLFAIFIGIPMLGYIFFQGNSGNIYDYYMTGYYLPMILLFSLGLGTLRHSKVGILMLVFFFITFFKINGELNRNYIRAGVDGPTDIRLKSEMQGVNWVYFDAKEKGISEFNVDVYVPPVIPHSYDYLFLWQGYARCGRNLCGNVKDKQLEIVYILYEVDPPHPERLTKWMDRYRSNTIVLEHHQFGGVHVERRKRI